MKITTRAGLVGFLLALSTVSIPKTEATVYNSETEQPSIESRLTRISKVIKQQENTAAESTTNDPEHLFIVAAFLNSAPSFRNHVNGWGNHAHGWINTGTFHNGGGFHNGGSAFRNGGGSGFHNGGGSAFRNGGGSGFHNGGGSAFRNGGSSGFRNY